MILASESPRRRQLLRAWGIPHRVVPSRLVEPAPRPTDTPVRYARRLALAKALAVAKRVLRDCPPKLRRSEGGLSLSWVLGADTIVVAGRRILGKPTSVADAERMLRRLAGTTHRVITAVALVQVTQGVRPEGWPPSTVRHAISRVTMRRLTPAEIARYARRHRDKAGSYAIQDSGETVVEKIEGSYTNVVGLPKEVVLPLLRRAGIRPASGR